MLQRKNNKKSIAAQRQNDRSAGEYRRHIPNISTIPIQ
jgi:hypothetical protein